MSAAAIGVATTLQNRVVGALGSAQNLLPAPELNSALLQAGATGIATNVLSQLKQGQEKLTELTSNIGTILQEQLDIAEEQQRRERDRSGQFRPGGDDRPVQGPPIPPVVEGDMDGAGFNLGNLLSAGMGAIFGAGGVLASGAAARFAKGLGKGLVRGGFYGLMASFLAKPLIEFVEDGVLKVEFGEQEKADMETAIMATAAGAGLFGKKGAFIALAGVGVKGVYDYLTGKSDEISNTEWASLFAGFGGIALTMTPLVASATKAMAGAGITASLTSVAGGIAIMPFLIAAGVGIAAGAGAKYLVDESKAMRQHLLDHLGKIVNITNEEFVKALTSEELSYKERLFGERLVSLFGGDVSKGAKIKEAAVGGSEQFEETGSLESQDSLNLQSVAKQYSQMTPADLEPLLLDNDRLELLLTTFNNLRNLAAKGAFGENSKPILTDLLKFGDLLRSTATDMVARGLDSENYRIGYIARGQGNQNLGSVDILQKLAEFDPSRITEKQQQIDEDKKLLEELKAERERINVPGLRDTPEENRLDDEISDLKRKINYDTQALNQMEVSLRNLTNYVPFDYETLKNIYSEDELKKLFEMSLMTLPERTQAQTINEQFKKFRELELSSGVMVNAPTDIKTESKKVESNYTLNGPTNHHMDQHLGGD